MNDQKNLLTLESLNEELYKKWIDFLSSNSNAGWRQHPRCDSIVKNSNNEKSIFIIGLEGEEIKFAGIYCLLSDITGLFILEATCLRGPVFNNISYAKHWLPQIDNYFRKLKVGSIRIGPYWRFPTALELENYLFSIGYRIYETNQSLGRRQTGIIDINRNEDAILKSFKQSTRYEIRHAIKESITVKTSNSMNDSLQFFQYLEYRDRERGIATVSKLEAEGISSFILNNSDAGAIICAYTNNSFLGGLLIARGGETAFTVKFVVSNECKRLHPTLRIAPSLFYQGMIWAKSHGCKLVDLEGYSSSNLNQGDLAYVNRYKSGFQPLACETLGQYYLIGNPTRYQLHKICSLVKKIIKQYPSRLLYRIKFLFIKKRVEKKNNSTDRK